MPPKPSLPSSRRAAALTGRLFGFFSDFFVFFFGLAFFPGLFFPRFPFFPAGCSRGARRRRRGGGGGRFGERLGAEFGGDLAQIRDALTQRVAQTRVDRGGQRGEVLFGPLQGGVGGGAAAVAFLGGDVDGFDVALQRAGFGGRDQALARAAAGDQRKRSRGDILTDRTPGARPASPAAGRRGSPRRRRRCRSRCGERRRSAPRCRAAATRRGGRRRGAVRRCRG